MNSSLPRSYRLVARGGAGLACDEDGLALGGVSLARVRLDPGGVRRCEARSPGEIDQILRSAYGAQPDGVVLRLHRGLGRAAAAIEAGDLGRAGVEAVRLRMPDLTPGAMTKLARIADLEKRNMAWENEPRVPAGQSGGGQWTTDGGGAPTAVVKPAVQALTDVAGRECAAPPPSADGDVDPTDRGLLIPISTATTALGQYGSPNDIAPPNDFTLPKDVARLGRAGLLALGAELLDGAVTNRAQEQISDAITRFGLDPDRPADVIAASAYVWSRYNLPFLTDAPFRGAALDAGSEAVLRFVLINPGAFLEMRDDSTSFSLIKAAANSGLADYVSESRARPAGVDPSLQTTSKSARAAIADQLKNGKMQAHHLIPAEVWGQYKQIAALAQDDGWQPDNPSNLIALPGDVATWEEWRQTLPMHNRGHPAYNAYTSAQIGFARSAFAYNLTPLLAHAILDNVALRNRLRILAGHYNPIVKVIR